MKRRQRKPIDILAHEIARAEQAVRSARASRLDALAELLAGLRGVDSYLRRMASTAHHERRLAALLERCRVREQTRADFALAADLHEEALALGTLDHCWRYGDGEVDGERSGLLVAEEEAKEMQAPARRRRL